MKGNNKVLAEVDKREQEVQYEIQSKLQRRRKYYTKHKDKFKYENKSLKGVVHNSPRQKTVRWYGDEDDDYS